ncbi:hypothetical protein LJR027_004296 [Terrabacter sp. LjRoot27]
MSRWLKRPFCMPPPKNCSWAPRARVCVIPLALHAIGAVSRSSSAPLASCSRRVIGDFVTVRRALAVEMTYAVPVSVTLDAPPA